MGENGGFSDAGLSFASGADLLVGQDVQIRPVTTSNVTTDLVRLWPSQITGTVGGVDTSNGTFTLTGLSPLFTGAMPAVTTITVETLSGLKVMDSDHASSGLPAADSKPVSVKGLLFKTPGMPTLVTRTMREHHDD